MRPVLLALSISAPRARVLPILSRVQKVQLEHVVRGFERNRKISASSKAPANKSILSFALDLRLINGALRET